MIGLILNLASIKMLRHKSLKHQFYKYLICKSICDSFVCLHGIGYLNSNSAYSHQNVYNTYSMLFYQINIIRNPLRCVFFISAASELGLTFIRIFSFSSKVNRLNSISIKYYMAIIVFVPVSVSTLPYFTVDIIATNVTGIYYWTSNPFGLSAFYKYYILIVLFIESVIPTILLVMYNLIVLIKYRRHMNEKHKLTKNCLKKSDVRFTKMILVLTGIFFVTHFFDMVMAILLRYYYYYAGDNVTISQLARSLINFLRQFVYLLQYTQYAFNIFIYVANDPNLYKIFSHFMLRIKFFN